MYRTDHTRLKPQRHPPAGCGCAKSSTIRREPLEVRKATLASLLAKAASGLRFNERDNAFGNEPMGRRFRKRLHDLGWIEGRNRNRGSLG